MIHVSIVLCRISIFPLSPFHDKTYFTCHLSSQASVAQLLRSTRPHVLDCQQTYRDHFVQLAGTLRRHGGGSDHLRFLIFQLDFNEYVGEYKPILMSIPPSFSRN